MKFRKLSLGLALLLSTAIGILIPGNVPATAIANSTISFSNLQITPDSGTVVFFDLWTAETFAQAQNSFGELDQQFDSSAGGSALANATVTFAAGHGDVSAANLTGTASSSVSIPGTTTAAASSQGQGTLFNWFPITGGTGDVQVSFSVDLTGSLNVFTHAFGQLAETETIFSLELDGTRFFFATIRSPSVPTHLSACPFPRPYQTRARFSSVPLTSSSRRPIPNRRESIKSPNRRRSR